MKVHETKGNIVKAFFITNSKQIILKCFNQGNKSKIFVKAN